MSAPTWSGCRDRLFVDDLPISCCTTLEYHIMNTHKHIHAETHIYIHTRYLSPLRLPGFQLSKKLYLPVNISHDFALVSVHSYNYPSSTPILILTAPSGRDAAAGDGILFCPIRSCHFPCRGYRVSCLGEQQSGGRSHSLGLPIFSCRDYGTTVVEL